MPSTKTGLTNADIASLTSARVTSWVVQGTYTASQLPPVGGRKITINSATDPDVGDALVVTINGTTLSPVTYDGYEDLVTAILAQSGVLGCWVRDDAKGVTILFDAGEKAEVTLEGFPDSAVATDITEGVEVASILRAIISTDFSGVRASLVVQDITFTANGAYRGTAGNSIAIVYVEAGTSTPLSVSVATTTITVNLETDSGGSAISTASEVYAALRSSEDAMGLVTVALTGNPTTVQVAAGSTSLSGGSATADHSFRVWQMLSSIDGTGNRWTLGPVNQFIDFAISSGISSGIRQSYTAPIAVDSIERLYVELVSITSGAEVTISIGLCGSEA